MAAVLLRLEDNEAEARKMRGLNAILAMAVVAD